MAINGKLYDWEDITVALPNGVAIGITEITYKDGQEVTPRYGKGGIPRGYGRGNYDASGSMTLDADEFERLSIYLTSSGGGSLYDHIAFPIVVSYANRYQPVVVDVLPQVKITSIDVSNSQGSDNAGAKKMEFKVLSPIAWNTKQAKLPLPV